MSYTTLSKGCHDIQHNDIKQNDIHRYDTQHDTQHSKIQQNVTQHSDKKTTPSIKALMITISSIILSDANCCVLHTVMLSVIMMNIVILNVVAPSNVFLDR